jgi:hypothetical protein
MEPFRGRAPSMTKASAKASDTMVVCMEGVALLGQ